MQIYTFYYITPNIVLVNCVERLFFPLQFMTWATAPCSRLKLILVYRDFVNLSEAAEPVETCAAALSACPHWHIAVMCSSYKGQRCYLRSCHGLSPLYISITPQKSKFFLPLIIKKWNTSLYIDYFKIYFKLFIYFFYFSWWKPQIHYLRKWKWS